MYYENTLYITLGNQFTLHVHLYMLTDAIQSMNKESEFEGKHHSN